MAFGYIPENPMQSTRGASDILLGIITGQVKEFTLYVFVSDDWYIVSVKVWTNYNESANQAHKQVYD